MKNSFLITFRSFVVSVGATAASAFVGVYGVLIGASAVEMGWLQSISNAVSNGGQLLWGRLSDKVGYRRPFLMIGGGILALMWFLMVHTRTPIELILVYGTISLFTALITVNWFSLIADETEISGRAKFLSRVNSFSSLGTILSLLVMTFFLGGEVTSSIAIPFYTAAASYLISIVAIYGIREKRRIAKQGGSLVKTLRTLKNTNYFYKYFIATNTQGFFWSLAWPMFPITIVSVMHFTLDEVAILTIFASSSALGIQLLLGKFTDRSNRPPMIFVNKVMLSFIPIFYAFFGNLDEFLVLELYSGVLSAIQNVVMNSYLLDIIPDNSRAEFISIINGFNGLIYLFGALAGGYLLSYLMSLYPLKIALMYSYIIVFVGRFSSSLLFLRLKEPKERKSVLLPLYQILIRNKPAGSPSGGTIKERP
ncbi:MAG: MFS transporter [Candidatus Thermoplasmatota archaeon]|nr:MFS transporter [Candidatus Thermoplasmatota archaeon]